MFTQRFRIVVLERDIYARQAIVSYLSWDRRTQVVEKAATFEQMVADVEDDPTLDRLDLVMLDTSLAPTPDELATMIDRIQDYLPGIAIICLAQEADIQLALAAEHAGARAYLTRDVLGIGLAGAVRFALWHTFTVTEDIYAMLAEHPEWLEHVMTKLPERRHYPRLTERIEEALWLCVVEGLPAERAAEEMGVSTSTVRSYIKEGYRILEEEDEITYPANVSPAERAFLRYSAIELPPDLLGSANK